MYVNIYAENVDVADTEAKHGGLMIFSAAHYFVSPPALTFMSFSYNNVFINSNRTNFRFKS
jgi:hypothetical protein